MWDLVRPRSESAVGSVVECAAILCASLLLVAACQQLGEFLDIDVTLAVGGCFGQDVVGFRGAELLTPGHQRMAQAVVVKKGAIRKCTKLIRRICLLLVLAAETVAFVELSKSVEDHLLLVRALRSVAEDGQEHGEVDWTRSLLDH